MAEKKPITIRKKKEYLWWTTILSGAILAMFLFNPKDNLINNYHEHPGWSIGLLLIFGILFTVFLLELIKNKPEITIYETGIDLRDKGYFTWDMMESFQTVFYNYYESDPDYIVFQFKEYKDMKYCIANLEKSRGAIISLILEYQNAEVIYTGHVVKQS